MPDPIAVYHTVLPVIAAHHRCFFPVDDALGVFSGTAYCLCNKWKHDDGSGLTHDEHVAEKVAYVVERLQS